LSATIIDPRIPHLSDSLDLRQAQTHLITVIPDIRAVTAATLVRHKPGRRALIEYQLDTAAGPLTILGKIRAKGTDWHSYHVQRSLWQQGFNADNPDGLAVPEPLGVIPMWRMWLQRSVPGIPATDLLLTTPSIPLIHRIAALAHKLHHTPVPTPKTHILADELAILHARLPLVADQYPQWRSRLTTILQECDRLSTLCPPQSGYPIHRDFYPDQILVDYPRLWLVDLDLHCQGDPALDIGNFIAHMTEQSLRQVGDPAALHDQEVALREAFVQAWITAGADGDRVDAQQLRMAIDHYTVLSLVRHIHISNRIAARRPLTAKILHLCETRLQSLRGFSGGKSLD